MEYSHFYDFAVKALDGDGIIEGYASTFGGPPDLQGDIIMPGAFTATLAANKGKVPILMAHQSSRIVGFGLDAAEDDKGLKIRGQFAIEADDGRNAYAIAKAAATAGSKLGLSIGYSVRKNGAEWDEETNTRKLKALDLWEWSIAATPANPRARVSRVKDCTTVRDGERLLCSLGMTGDEARQLISIFRGERDANHDEPETLERDAKEKQARMIRELLAEKRVQDLYYELKGI